MNEHALRLTDLLTLADRFAPTRSGARSNSTTSPVLEAPPLVIIDGELSPVRGQER
jgi:hypothetical protein